MSLSTVPSEEAKAQAADWFARLNKRDVPHADMEAFRIWRKAPGHKEAYDEVDAFWRRSAALQDDPDIKAAISGALARTPGPAAAPKARRLAYGLAFAVVLLAAFGGGYALWAPRTYSTGVGEQRTITLADGSTVVLDTDSQVSVRLGRARRDLRLDQGQALFDVAHDAVRPFVVTAGPTSVTALGTRFDVRRDRGGANITLVRGAVEVRDGAGGAPGHVWRLAPGQRIATRAPSGAPSRVDVDAATSWTSGRLIFRAVPLREAVAEFNRYERRKIEIADGAVGEALITGVFAVGDTDTFIGAVADLHDLAVVRDSKNGAIRLTRAGDGDASP
jgi:transmembrane sensor